MIYTHTFRLYEYLCRMRQRSFESILWSVDNLLPDHFVFFHHFSMEQALVPRSIVIVYSHTTLQKFYFEFIVAFLQSHFRQVKISLINTCALEDIQTQLHTFYSTHLQKSCCFCIKCDVKHSIRNI